MTTASDTSVDGAWAVVTGSSSGIGRSIALRLARAGRNLIVHGCRKREGANQTAESARRLGVRAEVLLADFADPAQIEGFVESAFAVGNVASWVNNAGADVLTGEAAAWGFEQKLARLWEIDVRSTIALSRSAGERMKQLGGGSLVNIGWDQAEFGMAGDSGEYFAAVKGAVMAFTKSLAKSLAPQVRVNCVAPGWVRTEWGAQASAYWQQRAEGESLLGRWGTPEDVAAAIAFLVSDEASFIHGQVLNVNGGWRGSFPEAGSSP